MRPAFREQKERARTQNKSNLLRVDFSLRKSNAAQIIK
jgi:hypothetical protein